MEGLTISAHEVDCNSLAAYIVKQLKYDLYAMFVCDFDVTYQTENIWMKFKVTLPNGRWNEWTVDGSTIGPQSYDLILFIGNFFLMIARWIEDKNQSMEDIA